MELESAKNMRDILGRCATRSSHYTIEQQNEYEKPTVYPELLEMLRFYNIAAQTADKLVSRPVKCETRSPELSILSSQYLQRLIDLPGTPYLDYSQSHQFDMEGSSTAQRESDAGDYHYSANPKLVRHLRAKNAQLRADNNALRAALYELQELRNRNAQLLAVLHDSKCHIQALTEDLKNKDKRIAALSRTLESEVLVHDSAQYSALVKNLTTRIQALEHDVYQRDVALETAALQHERLCEEFDARYNFYQEELKELKQQLYEFQQAQGPYVVYQTSFRARDSVSSSPKKVRFDDVPPIRKFEEIESMLKSQ